jgi:hypothetical protein
VYEAGEHGLSDSKNINRAPFGKRGVARRATKMRCSARFSPGSTPGD